MVMFAQGGKSDSLLDIIGQRFDQTPTPTLYLGPTKQFLNEQWEPRIEALLEESSSLAKKVGTAQQMTKTRKLISGVPLRLAHGGSSSSIKSDPFGLALTDEADELMANVRGQGDPIGLVDRRGDTYADFVHAIVSTPSEGPAEVAIDPDSGLAFWAKMDTADIGSTIWRLWQSGTRHHWAWPCPECGDYFIPRFALLKWDKPVLENGRTGPSDPILAHNTAHLSCPNCGCDIHNESKGEMNARGVYVAPGQSVNKNGEVVGLEPESWTISYWVSGLASPFRSWGERAAEYVQAVRSGDHVDIQAVKNGSFGELYAPGGGDVPDWRDLEKLKVVNAPYVLGQVPAGIRFLTAAVDVQKKSLYFSIRGWGARATSWLVDRGQLFGDTVYEDVWEQLEDVILSTYDGLPIKLCLIDSGFRPGNPKLVPENRVYSFCQRHARFCHPTKGRDTMIKPIQPSKIEIMTDWRGRQKKVGLELLHLDTDYFKRLVHERLQWDRDDPGAWLLPDDVDDEYLQQVVSEGRIKKPGGKPIWVKRRRDNHFFDCFDSKTELLTKDGWVSVVNVNRQMEFVTVNLATDAIEYQKATKVIHRPHQGEMIKILGRTIDAMVTPNHRMVTHKKGETGVDITLARDLTIWHKIKRTATWFGENHDEIEMGASSTEQAVRVNSMDLMDLLGWVVARGHRKKGSSRNWLTVIGQEPGSKQDRLLQLLSLLPWRYRVMCDRQIVITSEQFFDFINDAFVASEGCQSARKRVPTVVTRSNVKLIRKFMDTAIDCNGWVQGKSEFKTYVTISRQLADDMQVLFIKLGVTANISLVQPPACNVAGKEYPASLQYWISEICTPAANLRRADNTPIFSTVYHNGDVHCVCVPNTTLIARRNGKPFVVGNCEAMQAAAGFFLGAQRMGSVSPRSTQENRDRTASDSGSGKNSAADWSRQLNG